MKQSIILFYVAVFFASCNSSTKSETGPAVLNTDVSQQNLKGNIKSITEISSTIDSSGKETTDSLTTYIDFDGKGYQTRFQVKNKAGKIVSEQFASRNNAGVATEFGTKKNGQVFSRVVTEIDKDGKYVGGKSYDSTGKQDGYYKDLSQNEYAIVYAGKHFGLNNKVKESWEMKYDKNHFLGGKSMDSTGKATYEGSAKVNDKGDMSEESYSYWDNGRFKSEKKSYKYDSYDDKGNWTHRTTFNDKGKKTQLFKRNISYYN